MTTERCFRDIPKTEKQDKEFSWPVDMWESERSWGSKVDTTYFFKTQEDAEEFILKYNDKFNNSSEVPDWYMVARAAWTVVSFRIG